MVCSRKLPFTGQRGRAELRIAVVFFPEILPISLKSCIFPLLNCESSYVGCFVFISCAVGKKSDLRVVVLAPPPEDTLLFF